MSHIPFGYGEVGRAVMTEHQYFLQLKINEACRLLLDHVPVKDIAFRLAFENPYYFSRLFKKKTGLSPTEWQRGALLSEEKPFTKAVVY